VYAAVAAHVVRWVGVGQVWRYDSVGCPACGGRIVFDHVGSWACDQCEFARPECVAWLEGTELVLKDGFRIEVDIGLPGQFNRANAAMVAVAVPEMTGTDFETRSMAVAQALKRMAVVHDVAGRFALTARKGHSVRQLLAKNPAGWTAIFDLLEEDASEHAPVVLSVNARVADGFDTSWLWDVPFERLVGSQVVVTGERRQDLAVRLHYAEVNHTVIEDPLAAVDHAIGLMDPLTDAGASISTKRPIDILANYTAFAHLKERLR
jgi:lipid II isoglutaminyl synthase (glutamine-hydrolysing)